MAENSTASGNKALYFLVGGLTVVVGVLAFMILRDEIGDHGGKLQISIEAPNKVR